MFKQVKRVEETQNSGDSKYLAKPGINDFDITGVESSITSTNKQMIKVLFTSTDAKSYFSATFFITENAIGRLFSLASDAGVTDEQFYTVGDRNDAIDVKIASNEALNEEETNAFRVRVEEDLRGLLVGRQVRLLTGGVIKDDTKNNNPNGYITPELPYANFSESVNVPFAETKLKYDPAKHIKDTRTNKTTTSSTTPKVNGESNDLPF